MKEEITGSAEVSDRKNKDKIASAADGNRLASAGVSGDKNREAVSTGVPAPDNKSNAAGLADNIHVAGDNAASEESVGSVVEASGGEGESGAAVAAREDSSLIHEGDEVKIIRVGNSREVVVPADTNRLRSYIMATLFIIVAAITRGISSYCFVSPNNFAVGGVSGIAIMIEHLTGVNQGIFNLAMNIPLLVISFFFLSKRFCITTLGYTGLFSLTTIVIELIEKSTGKVLVYHDDEVAILSAVFGGVLSGFGFVLMMRAGGCQGGSDIAAAIVNKRRPDMPIAWVIFAIDSIVILASYFVYNNGLTPILLAIIESFSASVVGNTFLKGMKSAIKAEIVTLHCDEISAEIFERLGKGVTVVDSIGQYTGTHRKLLNCVINRRQLGELERILKKYPDTFAYIMSANEVFGAWSK